MPLTPSLGTQHGKVSDAVFRGIQSNSAFHKFHRMPSAGTHFVHSFVHAMSGLPPSNESEL